jgi:hypothetical protein
LSTRRWIPLVCIGLCACGPKIDPLYPMTAELSKARRDGPDRAEPHLRFTLANRTASALVQESIADPDAPILFGFGIGVALIEPKLDPPTLVLTDSPGCDCPRADITVGGAVDIELQGLMGKRKLADGLGFSAHIVGATELSVNRVSPEGERLVTLEPVGGDPWAVDIQLAEEKGMLTNDVVRDQVAAPLLALLSKPVPLARIPAEVPVELARLAVEPGDDLTAAAWLKAAPADPPPDVQIDDGWVVATTESALTAGARAALVSMQQHPRFKIEPLAVTVDDGTWTADVRLHKVARKAKYRDYTIAGDFAIDDVIRIAPTSVERTEKAGWGLSLVGGFIDGRIRKQVLDLELELANTSRSKVVNRAVELKVQRVESEGSKVFVYGGITSEPWKDEPPTASASPDEE